MKMFFDGRIKAFHTDRYEAGHRATDYKRWMQAARPYPIQCVASGWAGLVKGG